VKEVFKASPFLVGDDCVSIMNGTDEGRVSRSLLCDKAVLGDKAVFRAAIGIPSGSVLLSQTWAGKN